MVFSASSLFHLMLQLITILNRCHRFPGFVYHQATGRTANAGVVYELDSRVLFGISISVSK